MSLRSSGLPSLLLWIDLETSDPKGASEIQQKYPELEIIFKTTYSAADIYFGQNAREIEQREKFIIICRGFYASESKSFLDVAQLFQVCNSAKTHLGVYTGNRANLLERNPNPPQGVEIFDKRHGLLAFVDRCLAR